jgi:hypothetical protein
MNDKYNTEENPNEKSPLRLADKAGSNKRTSSITSDVRNRSITRKVKSIY